MVVKNQTRIVCIKCAQNNVGDVNECAGTSAKHVNAPDPPERGAQGYRQKVRRLYGGAQVIS